MARKINENYRYFREFQDDVTINCFTGGIKTLLEEQKYIIPEYYIWTLGEGYKLSCGEDEYGCPEIWFKLFDIVDRFSSKCNIKINQIKLDVDNVKKQIADLLEEKGLVVWVNSKYMKYSDLYYSNNGYLHAVVLKSLDKEKNLVRIKDNLIVSVPPLSCLADLEYTDLYLGLTDIVKSKEVDVMGTMYNLVVDSDSKGIDRRMLIDSLHKMSYEISKDNFSALEEIRKYWNSCDKYIKDNPDKMEWMLRRINDNIKTLYVIPNRLLLKETLNEVLDKNDKGIKEKLDEVIELWKNIGNLCLKSSITKRKRELESINDYFEKIIETEKIFWGNLNEILGGTYEG